MGKPADPVRIRTLDDLDRAVRTVATHFATDTVYVIGSQAVLLEWPEAPVLMRVSPEIDIYPGNAREWEARQGAGGEASEEIFALFGEMSRFHETHGFYLDGVDDGTARMPPDWRSRALTRKINAHGRTVTAIAPSAHDLAVSKLHRLEEKDRVFIATRHAAEPYDIELLEALLRASGPAPETLSIALAFLNSL